MTGMAAGTIFMAAGMPIMMMQTAWMRAYCRKCSTRSYMPKEEYQANQACSNCGKQYLSSDVRETRQVPKEEVNKHQPLSTADVGASSERAEKPEKQERSPSTEKPAQRPWTQVDSEALAILQRRLALGEISPQEYREILKALDEGLVRLDRQD